MYIHQNLLVYSVDLCMKQPVYDDEFWRYFAKYQNCSTLLLWEYRLLRFKMQYIILNLSESRHQRGFIKNVDAIPLLNHTR